MFFLVVIATFVIALIASARVKANFRRFSQVPALSGLTGAEAARQILARAGISHVQVVPTPGVLTDHYDPINKRLALSEAVYHHNSVAALGVAAHEAGHAIQHQAAYGPLFARMALVKVQGIASQMVLWLPLIGMGLHIITPRSFFFLLSIGWGAIMLFNLVTLPVEFDASRRAKLVLGDLGLIRTPEEAHGVNKVLGAAAWTYVAAFLTSLAYFLFYLLPLLTGGRRE